MSKSRVVHIIGAGLAGSEAAYFLAQRGIQVLLHEMRPVLQTPAHQTDRCAELVCSNSFKSQLLESAPGVLKSEMTDMGSLVLPIAHESSVPGGQALAVDRDVFSEKITHALSTHSNIELIKGEIDAPHPDVPTIIATGPLTSDRLSQWLVQATGSTDLYFYDAIAPIVDAESVDPETSFLANRYDRGEETAYLNCPMNKEEYLAFFEALSSAEKVAPKNFEKEKFFHSCQPIEAIAATGVDSLRYGPLKPVGLTDPRQPDQKFYAVLQLRPENKSRTAYNLVGFQTKLKYPEQKRVFSLIPALRNAEFLRLGSIHRNTYVCGPKVLRPDLSLKGFPQTYLAGQITGVEGYLESAACGLLAALFAYQRVEGLPHRAPPLNTLMGSLLRYIVGGDAKNYQPTNVHFGLFEPNLFKNIVGLKRDQARKGLSEQSRANFSQWWDQIESRDQARI